MRATSPPWAGARTCVLAASIVAVLAEPTWAQTPPVPPPTIPPASPTAGGLTSAERDAYEARIQRLERMMQELMDRQNQGGGTATGTDSKETGTSPGSGTGATAATGSASGGSGSSGSGGSNTPSSGASPGGNSPSTSPSAVGGPLAPGQSSPPNPTPSARFAMPATTIGAPLTGKFGPGFEFKTADEEFVLQFHNLTQVDGRFYEQGGQAPVRDTFTIPRQWFMFSGRITKPWEYFVSFQNVFDTINGLDIFLNAHYDDRLQLKVGRFKTPFTYEFYTEPIQGLISPERSLFFNNFALNRSIGGQLWGRLFNDTAPLDYAVGVFNGARNSYLDGSDAKNVLGYLNWRPFATFADTPLENFVIGGSVMEGNQTNTPVPATLRTVVPTTGNAIIGVPFLAFNSNVRESGPRAFWDLHAALYYRQLSLIAEWQSGYQDYALTTNLAAHDRVGVQSYYVQAGYFLTGETVSGRGVVKPLRDFDIRRGKVGPGAIEATARFNALNLTRNVFAAGLADPNLWTSNLYTVDVGANWYLNQYVKLYFDWNHAVFGNNVQYNATATQKTSDLFWVRFQLFF